MIFTSFVLQRNEKNISGRNQLVKKFAEEYNFSGNVACLEQVFASAKDFSFYGLLMLFVVRVIIVAVVVCGALITVIFMIARSCQLNSYMIYSFLPL